MTMLIKLQKYLSSKNIKIHNIFNLFQKSSFKSRHTVKFSSTRYQKLFSFLHNFVELFASVIAMLNFYFNLNNCSKDCDA